MQSCAARDRSRTLQVIDAVRKTTKPASPRGYRHHLCQFDGLYKNIVDLLCSFEDNSGTLRLLRENKRAIQFARALDHAVGASRRAHNTASHARWPRLCQGGGKSVHRDDARIIPLHLVSCLPAHASPPDRARTRLHAERGRRIDGGCRAWRPGEHPLGRLCSSRHAARALLRSNVSGCGHGVARVRRPLCTSKPTSRTVTRPGAAGVSTARCGAGRATNGQERPRHAVHAEVPLQRGHDPRPALSRTSMDLLIPCTRLHPTSASRARLRGSTVSSSFGRQNTTAHKTNQLERPVPSWGNVNLSSPDSSMYATKLDTMS